MKGSRVTVVVILILSLAIWMFFEIYSKGLDKAEIAVVVGFSIVVVLAGKWLWTRIFKKEK